MKKLAKKGKRLVVFSRSIYFVHFSVTNRQKPCLYDSFIGRRVAYRW